jgi:hypothetical protein
MQPGVQRPDIRLQSIQTRAEGRRLPEEPQNSGQQQKDNQTNDRFHARGGVVS